MNSLFEKAMEQDHRPSAILTEIDQLTLALNTMLNQVNEVIKTRGIDVSAELTGESADLAKMKHGLMVCLESVYYLKDMRINSQCPDSVSYCQNRLIEICDYFESAEFKQFEDVIQSLNATYVGDGEPPEPLLPHHETPSKDEPPEPSAPEESPPSSH